MTEKFSIPIPEIPESVLEELAKINIPPVDTNFPPVWWGSPCTAKEIKKNISDLEIEKFSIPIPEIPESVLEELAKIKIDIPSNVDLSNIPPLIFSTPEIYGFNGTPVVYGSGVEVKWDASVFNKKKVKKYREITEPFEAQNDQSMR